MCPTMMAEPIAPGLGLPVYQPATEVEDGTCNAPLDVRPRVISGVLTPINGMVSKTGRATGRGSADCGGATIGPIGAGSAATPAATGRRAGVECRVSSRPTVPPTIKTRPTASANAAAGLRVARARVAPVRRAHKRRTRVRFAPWRSVPARSARARSLGLMFRSCFRRPTTAERPGRRAVPMAPVPGRQDLGGATACVSTRG